MLALLWSSAALMEASSGSRRSSLTASIYSNAFLAVFSSSSTSLYKPACMTGFCNSRTTLSRSKFFVQMSKSRGTPIASPIDFRILNDRAWKVAIGKPVAFKPEFDAILSFNSSAAFFENVQQIICLGLIFWLNRNS